MFVNRNLSCITSDLITRIITRLHQARHLHDGVKANGSWQLANSRILVADSHLHAATPPGEPWRARSTCTGWKPFFTSFALISMTRILPCTTPLVTLIPNAEQRVLFQLEQVNAKRAATRMTVRGKMKFLRASMKCFALSRWIFFCGSRRRCAYCAILGRVLLVISCWSYKIFWKMLVKLVWSWMVWLLNGLIIIFCVRSYQLELVNR